MMWTDVNFFAVIVAAVASMVIGTIWYGPLFGKQWMTEMKMGPQDMERAKKSGTMPRLYTTQALLSLISAYALALIISAMGLVSIGSAIALGIVVAVGFVGTVKYQDILWTPGSRTLFYLNVGCNIVTMVVMAVILTIWQ